MQNLSDSVIIVDVLTGRYLGQCTATASRDDSDNVKKFLQLEVSRTLVFSENSIA